MCTLQDDVGNTLKKSAMKIQHVYAPLFVVFPTNL